MENTNNTIETTNDGINANDSSHYKLLTIGIIITLLGVLLRFLGHWSLIDLISNVILVIGVGICLRAIYNVLR